MLSFRPWPALLTTLVFPGCHHAAPQPQAATPSTAASPAPPGVASYRVVDATDPFFSFVDDSSGLAEQDKIRAFRERVVGAHPTLFVPGVIGVAARRDHDDLDERLPNYFASLPPRLPAMRKLKAALRTDLQTHDARFRRALPDMAWSGTVYFTVSVDAFDGSLRTVNGEQALLFGIDKIAQIHGADVDLGALFHHELFHAYQATVNDSLTPSESSHGLILPLWVEGLAVYVSKQLNPQATSAQILLSDDMIASTDAKRPAIIREILASLDEASEETFRDFFLGSSTRTDVPKRCGYYLGYRVAQRLGENRTLQELARLKGAPLRAEVVAALTALGEP